MEERRGEMRRIWRERERERKGKREGWEVKKGGREGGRKRKGGTYLPTVIPYLHEYLLVINTQGREGSAGGGGREELWHQNVGTQQRGRREGGREGGRNGEVSSATLILLSHYPCRSSTQESTTLQVHSSFFMCPRSANAYPLSLPPSLPPFLPSLSR